MINKRTDINKLIKNWEFLLLVAVILTIIVYAFCSTPFMQETQLKMLDNLFRLDPTPAKADSNIVLIAIDDYSLDFFNENEISWPWPRSFYGFAMDYFTDAGARSVIFDMQFYEADIDREETYAWETDASFADALKRNGNTFLGSQLLVDSTFIHTKIIASSCDVSGQYPYSNAFKGLRAPIDTLLKTNKAIGVINASPDSDGVIRRINLLSKLNNIILPQMSLQVVLHQETIEKKITIGKNKLQVGKREIPFNKYGKYLINWYGRTADRQPFAIYPLRAVIVSASAMLNGNEPIIDPSIFTDKHIIIGATAAGLLDLKTNPYTKIMPGMEIWATTLSNFINEDYITILPEWVNLMLTLIMIFFVMYFVTNLPAKKANLLVLIMMVISILSSLFLWKYYRIILDSVIPLTGFIFSYLLVNTVSYLLEGKSRREIRKMFSRYINEEIILQLEENPDQIKLGGAEIDATVLYTDIYNFTTISENKSPTELVEDLNKYFETLVEIVFNNFGLLDKYTGDGIMALFGAPIPRPDHALLACKAAVAHKQYRKELKKKKNLTMVEQLHLKTRTGINSGKLIAGNIGSDRRMDYTAIGDTVNLAARLEGVNKIYETNIIISEFTYEHVKDEFLCRELDSLRVKGRSQPTKIFEVIASFEGRKDKNKPQWIELYEEALNLYRKGDLQEAGNIFDELADEPINDRASGVMLKRCMYLMEFPPVEWDGILTLEVK
jgi:adenylate cyclase